MASKPIVLSLVIVNWNTQELLKQCLDSLYRNLPQFPTEIIIVDNGSTDGSLEMLASNFSDIKIIRNKDNLGFPKANNQGMKVSHGSYICLLNSDTKIDHDVFGPMVDYMESNHEVGIVGSRLKNADGSLQFSFGELPSLVGIFCQQGVPLHIIWGLKKFLPTLMCVDKSKYRQSHPVGWVKGACLLLTRGVYEKIGGLDERLFMYMEEVEYCKRCSDSGVEVHYLADVSVWHLERGSSKTGIRGSILGIYRGLYHYFRLHKPSWQLPILAGILRLGALLRMAKDPQTYWQALRIPTH